MAYSVVGDDFATWIQSGIEFRNQKMATEKKMLIEADQDIFNAFHTNTSVSSKSSILSFSSEPSPFSLFFPP